MFNEFYNWSGQTDPIVPRFKMNTAIFAGEACLSTIESEDEAALSFAYAAGAWSSDGLAVQFDADLDRTTETFETAAGKYDYNYVWCFNMAHEDSGVVDGIVRTTYATAACDFTGVIDSSGTGFEYICGPRRCDVNVFAMDGVGGVIEYEGSDLEWYPGEVSLSGLFKHEVGHVIGMGHNSLGYDESVMSSCVMSSTGEDAPCESWGGVPIYLTALDFQARDFLYSD